MSDFGGLEKRELDRWLTREPEPPVEVCECGHFGEDHGSEVGEPDMIAVGHPGRWTYPCAVPGCECADFDDGRR